MAGIDIAVCTFRRPFLAETLRSIGRLDVIGHAVRIIVADNDIVPSARPLVDELRAELPFPLHYVHAPASNICIARNACLEAAQADYLAFIDDDEVVSPTWLAALVRRADATGATAVLGPVRAAYPVTAPAWMVAGDFHSTQPVFINGAIRTGYTCNVLIRRTEPIKGLRFDPALGRSGGEDTDYFYCLTALGGTIDYAPDALVEEPVLADRTTMAWLIRRRLRFGQTHGALLRTSPFRALPMVVAKIVFCGLMTGLTAFSPIRRRRNWLRAVLHFGVAGGILGMRQAQHYGQPASS